MISIQFVRNLARTNKFIAETLDQFNFSKPQFIRLGLFFEKNNLIALHTKKTEIF
jgi:hypothetical protein